MKNLLFSFEDLTVKDKAAKQAIRYFSRAGANVVQQDIPSALKRSSGVTYREMALTFADSQTVVLRIKQSGDIFQVLLNDVGAGAREIADGLLGRLVLDRQVFEAEE
jgi:Asp-tRNA(Asn)/Glu-tRNA(Gln) amidotransferase A subunit family amidase